MSSSQMVYFIGFTLEENKRLKAENEKLRNQYESLLETYLKEKIDSFSAKISSYLENVKEKNRRLEVENKELRERIESLECELKTLKAKQQILKDEQQILKDEHQTFKDKFDSMEVATKKSDAQLHAYDLAQMFVFYFVKPMLPRNTLWKNLANKLANNIADVKDKVLSPEDFDCWLQKQPEAASLVDQRLMMKGRHSVVHTDLRSIEAQELFLTQVEKYSWAPLPEHELVIRSMIERLQKVNKKRMN